MIISRKTKRNLYRILPFGVIFVLHGWAFLYVEYAASNQFLATPQTAINPDIKIFTVASVAMLIVGCIIGISEIYILNNLFKKKSFAIKLISKILIYSTFLFIITCILYPIAASMEMNLSLFDPQVWTRLYEYLQSPNNVSTFLQMFISLFASLFFFEISENLGPGILFNFFTGKYHQPREEQRIFMFLDMVSSTTIAENLGHIIYFKLLQDYYNTFSDAVINNRGEVYQYIGDEIVISWKTSTPGENADCIRCFFEMKKAMALREDYFFGKYGVKPGFRAGIHVGEVTIGEIGALKKEITFSGDVLNTTSRIQGLCKVLNTDLLISEELLKRMNASDHFEVIQLGKQELRGKENELHLYTLAPMRTINRAN
jgi:adenylate cyclase